MQLKNKSLLEPGCVAFPQQSIEHATTGAKSFICQVLDLPPTWAKSSSKYCACHQNLSQTLFQVLGLPQTWAKPCSKYCACNQHEPSPCSGQVLCLPTANM